MNENKIGINPSPSEYEKFYKGQYNGIRFLIIYSKTYENDYGETNYTIEINWIDFLEEERQKIVNQAIVKLFKHKIDSKQIIQD